MLQNFIQKQLMKQKRYIDNREHRSSIFTPTKEDPTLVVCPKCHSKGLIFPDLDERVKYVCTNCTFDKRMCNQTLSFRWNEANPTDGYFGFNLWLQINCCGNSLWAFNKRHLAILDSYIKATLRERKPVSHGWCGNSSIPSKLPKWIKSHKNRQQLLKAIQKLHERL